MSKARMGPFSPLRFIELPAAGGERASPFPSLAAAAAVSVQERQANRLQELEKMLKEVQGRAEIIEKEAYEKAYLAGEKAGMALGEKRAEHILESLRQILRQAEQQLIEIHRSFAEAAIDLAEFIAGEIVGEALASAPETLLDIADRVAKRLPASGRLKLAIHPDDMAVLQPLLESGSGLSELSRAVLSADASLPRGACRVISATQDAWIDPRAAVHHCIEELRPSLLRTQRGEASAAMTPEPSGGDDAAG